MNWNVGSWLGLLRPSERDKLQVGIRELDAVLHALPVEQHDVAAEKAQMMMGSCHFLVEVVNEIAGRLKYLEEPEGAR